MTMAQPQLQIRQSQAPHATGSAEGSTARPAPCRHEDGSAPGSTFESILFSASQPEIDDCPAPDSFRDLNLDQLFAAVAAGREEYDLDPLFCTTLQDIDAVAFRQEVVLDLQEDALREGISDFGRAMAEMRRYLGLAERLYYFYEKASWLLHAADVYGQAVRTLAEKLDRLELRSRGFQGLREFLRGYAGAQAFTTLSADTAAVKDQLAAVTYRLNVNGNRVTVSRYQGEPDYSVEVEQTFQKFRQGAVENYRLRLADQANLNHVEAAIIELIARLYPEAFAGLRQFWERHRGFLDPTIRRFDREVQFYLAYLEFIQPLKAAGLAFCLPSVTRQSKEVRASDTFDLALASSLRQHGDAPVPNDFYLTGPERVLVVSGPNQGGKTTFARMFGQLHYLASLGYPVPGREAQLYLCDCVFTHFEREEQIENLRGKLQDELVRIHDILRQATGDSVLIMNESFASTTVEDATFLGREALRQIIERDMLAVYVTFIDELASLSEATVSMVSTVVPENPALRTYRLVRKPADGLAYALAIAEKHRVTYHALKRRLQP